MSNSEQNHSSSRLKGSVLSKNELLKRLNEVDSDKRIVITPLIDPKTQVGTGSIDVRLGSDFVLFKKNKYSSLDPLNGNYESMGEFQEKICVKMGDRIFIHPREFILGITLEYVKLPPDISAYITSRSTWGRLGLVIATATAIHPSYAGVITLEITNLGETPIPLYPSLRIAQIIFHTAEYQKIETFGSYFMSIAPSFSKILLEPEWEILKKLQS